MDDFPESSLTVAEIRDIAFKTTGQSKSDFWMDYRNGRLTASNFGRAVSVMRNPHPTNIQRLQEDIYHPKNLDNIPAIKWGKVHEGQAIDQYAKSMKVIVKPTGIWLFPNSIMGASPDGLVFQGPHDAKPIGVVEVKCPYSLRETDIEDLCDWHTHLKYLDCDNRLKKGTPYWQQVQGQIHAVAVPWCDFVIWTPTNMIVSRTFKDPQWTNEFYFKLENFFHTQLDRKEDFEYGEDSADLSYDLSFRDTSVFSDECPMRDLTSILHPIGPACQSIRAHMIQTFQFHITRLVYEILSISKSGLKWTSAVTLYWEQVIQNICEMCLRKLFNAKWEANSSFTTRSEVSDIFNTIMDEDCIWGTLLYDIDFANIIRTRVKSYTPTAFSKLAACTCSKRYDI